MISRSEQEDAAFSLKTEILLPAPLESVFGFFADANNLNTLTPVWLDFRILTALPIEMRQGTLIDYRLRLHGVPICWQTEITDWEPPYRFVDTQVKGPYRLWRHEHTFYQQDGQTLVCDNVEYSVLGGPLVHWLVVKRDLERIFQFRLKQLRKAFLNTETQPPCEI